MHGKMDQIVNECVTGAQPAAPRVSDDSLMDMWMTNLQQRRRERKAARHNAQQQLPSAAARPAAEAVPCPAVEPAAAQEDAKAAQHSRCRGVVTRVGAHPMLTIPDVGSFRFAYRNVKKFSGEKRPVVELGDEVECKLLMKTSPPVALSVRLLKMDKSRPRDATPQPEQGSAGSAAPLNELGCDIESLVSTVSGVSGSEPSMSVTPRSDQLRTIGTPPTPLTPSPAQLLAARLAMTPQPMPMQGLIPGFPLTPILFDAQPHFI